MGGYVFPSSDIRQVQFFIPLQKTVYLLWFKRKIKITPVLQWWRPTDTTMQPTLPNLYHSLLLTKFTPYNEFQKPKEQLVEEIKYPMRGSGQRQPGFCHVLLPSTGTACAATLSLTYNNSYLMVQRPPWSCFSQQTLGKSWLQKYSGLCS